MLRVALPNKGRLAEDVRELFGDAGLEVREQKPVDPILDKYIQAIGGAQRLAALTSFTGKGTYAGYDTDHQKVPVDIFAKAPDQYAMIVHGVGATNGDSIRAFDGRAGWIR